MHKLNAIEIAEKLMDEHGLNKWSFRFDDLHGSGFCSHSKRRITMSSRWPERVTADEFKRVMVRLIHQAKAPHAFLAAMKATR